MIFDGLLEPITIIIKLPRSLKDKFTVQYEAIGLTVGDCSSEEATLVAEEYALTFISETVQKYIPAGSPCIILDEDNAEWSGITIPIGQK